MDSSYMAQLGVVLIQVLIILTIIQSMVVKEKGKLQKRLWMFPFIALFVFALLTFIGDRINLPSTLADTLATGVASNECLLLYFGSIWVEERHKRNEAIYQNYIKYGVLLLKYVALGFGILLTLVAIADLFI
ncbi:hypothetical protein P4493_04820 [Bacillus thuringiensis]|uniref:Uncharacterized protein n=1 Tax=Bacillus thuringiensis HD-789 TaxID=1217737 RepID=A0A9W3JUV5_BACTU|nr:MULTISPECIES: hypothetical protein [Bacillus]MEC2534367.1 hypothetical protein [Bacillus cereus]MED1153684.1 hypothetical protein [Bacillus paranthracis]AFQ30004.1 hypothetical protein BTF1_29517 [Bacillus thuringiensis HD-789]MCC4008918.1 hypothetical protein [Bacillus thuringiensis]MCC4027963.1 hypothetical protein [Bacillus thuringiensis]